MMTLIIIGFGVFSLSNLKVTLFPSLNIPVLAISTGYQNVAPQDISRLLVEPIEGAVSSIEGIDELDSNIRKGSAFIILRLEDGVNVRRTELKVREALGRIRSDLPTEAREPVIFQFDPDNRPIMRLSLEASNRGLDELRRLGVEFIEPRLERLNGVASADTRGGLQRKIYVNVDPMSLAQYNLSTQEVESALRSNNVQVPIGDVRTNRMSYSVRALSMYTNLKQIKQTVIKTSDNGVPIRIGDVAEVDDGYEKVTTLVEVDGKNSVSIEIQKQSDANTLDVVNAVKGQIPNIESKLPEGVSIQVLMDEGENIENSISNLTQSALVALAVVIVILLLFMGGWRISLVVASSIPVSVTATFAAMYFAGISLNILSITALALAVGLLVDNAIVVSESIASKLEQDMSRFEAALEGTNEVMGALLGSTLTTLGVFVPIIGISGVQGQLFRDFALTISIAISISFLASIILIPVLASMLLNKEEFQRHSLTFRGIHKLEKLYVAGLAWVLRHKYTVAIFIIATLGGTYYLFTTIPPEFFPQSDSGQINVDVELPPGTKLVRTAGTIHDFSRQIRDIKEVKTVVTKIGQRHFTTESNIGSISITLVDAEQRERSTNDIALQLRRKLDKPGVKVNISAGGGMRFGNFGGDIRLSVVGPDVDVLQAVSDQIEQVVMQDSSVISVDNGRSDPTPELHYLVDRQRISRMGRNLSEVASSLKTQVQGTRVGYYREQGREVPIEVRARESALKNRTDLFNLEVLQVNGQRIPISALGHFESTQGLDRISRRDRETVLDVNISVHGNPSLFRTKIEQMIKDRVVLPDGYRYEFSGSTRRQREGSGQMRWALLFAIALTYMVMASLFENFRDPFVIMFSIPLALFGALAGLFLTGTNLSITAYIGIVMLVGVVVNNGIVLVDYIHLYTARFEGSDHYGNNLVEACRRRMRPIMLTALTTICSMIPLALEIGTGAELWAPLARAVIGGLLFATILTLFVIPVFVVAISKDRREAIKSLKE